MSAWYNENDPFPAEWLRNLIAAGHLPAGSVDERSIADLEPSDCPEVAHFFAGIGGWPYALRLAGWPDDAPVWTGSCPCQPFSPAGRRAEHADERHLWPAWFRLIRERRPGVIFGEQVAGPAGERWLDAVQADMEAEGYAFGSVELCAAGVGAPHRRQRLYWVADAPGRGTATGELTGRGRRAEPGCIVGNSNGGGSPARSEAAAAARHGNPALADGHMGDTDDAGPQGLAGLVGTGSGERALGATGPARRVAVPDGGIAGDGLLQRGGEHGQQPEDGRVGGLGNPAGEQTRRTRLARQDFWRSCDWLPCRDGKSRPVEPGTFPLAHGVPGRVGRLRAYGNAIVPQVAAEFVRAFMGAAAPASGEGRTP